MIAALIRCPWGRISCSSPMAAAPSRLAGPATASAWVAHAAWRQRRPAPAFLKLNATPDHAREAFAEGVCDTVHGAGCCAWHEGEQREGPVGIAGLGCTSPPAPSLPPHMHDFPDHLLLYCRVCRPEQPTNRMETAAPLRLSPSHHWFSRAS